MKKILSIVFLLFASVSLVSAQMRPPTYSSGSDGADGGFKKENIFVGGTLGLGFAGNTFSIGGNPEIGCTLAQWLDAGFVVNLNYYSERADPTDIYNDNIRTREFNYGAGVFTRIYPVNFLFLQLQPEENWINYNQKDFNSGQTYSTTTNAFSFIAGVGYTRRMVGEGSYFLMVGLDLADNLYSPYRDYNGAQIPIVRAGFDFYLGGSKKRK